MARRKKETPDSFSGPIGVFDSGIGGLTVVRRIMEILPNESIVYVGDTARIPYGPKSPQVIREFSTEIGNYLVAQGVKIVVIACNTASSFGLSTLAATLPVPVLGVVVPGARAAVEVSRSGRIGVIGTRGTVSSEAYQNAIMAIRPDARVFALAAPLFVPLIEEGHLAGSEPLVRRALDLYVKPLAAKRIDTLVLGCTHYPLLEPAIRRYLGKTIRVVDSAKATAVELQRALVARHAVSLAGKPRNLFLATDDAVAFRRLGERFLGTRLGAVVPLSLDELARWRG